MATYKELVDELRDVARRSSGEQKVIDLLIFAADVIDNLYNNNMDLSGELKRIMELYEAEKDCREQFGAGLAAALERIPEWVKVADRLPDVWSDVLVAVLKHRPRSEPVRTMAVDFITMTGEWAKMSCDWRNEVTHWMPLPAAPKEEKDG